MLAQTVKYALRNPPNMPRICSCMLSIFRRGALGAGLSEAHCPAGRRQGDASASRDGPTGDGPAARRMPSQNDSIRAVQDVV